MTKERMSSLELGKRTEETSSVHPGGDCSCGSGHISERMYLGYSLCLICQKLSKHERKSAKVTDHLIRLRSRRRRAKVGIKDQAVAYLSSFLGSNGKAITRETWGRKGSWDKWVRSFHMSLGQEIRNALRKAGFNERVLGVRNLDDIYVELLARAVGLEAYL